MSESYYHEGDYPFYNELSIRSEQEFKRWFVGNLALDGCENCSSKDVLVLYWQPGVFYTFCRSCQQCVYHDYNHGYSELVGGQIHFDHMCHLACLPE